MLSENDIKELHKIFKIELLEQYHVMEESLKKLAHAENKSAAIEDAYRSAHNIKGAAKSLSFDNVAIIAEALETEFARWRHSDVNLDDDLLENCLQKAKAMLDAFQPDKV
jgi:two-component system, chemotaxis family, sensor kinase CheA